MNKLLNPLPFISIGAIFHVIATYWTVLQRVGCAEGYQCLSELQRLVEAILSFPSAPVAKALGLGEGTVTLFAIFVYPVANSIAAIALIWVAVVWLPRFFFRARPNTSADAGERGRD